MPRLAQVPDWDRAPEESVAKVRRVRRSKRRYYAFLSYSHRDQEMADWLHSELEEFPVPASLAGRLTANGTIPKRLKPIFRDRHDLAAADDLGAEIRAALDSSQFLIVLCSPDAAKSRWTNAEVDEFKRSRPDGCVLAAIVAGEPFASDIPGREDEECFPPALRHKYDRRGRPTGRRAEPVAADFRESGDGQRMGFLKLVAGMLGVGLDDLVQRDNTRRQRRLGYLLAASLAGMAVTSTLAVTAIQARDSARDQRREAEGLIGFMLGDLKDKLEPIGRLDALDGVGSRVLAYYHKQDTAELSDAALSQRSRALTLMGEVASLRGDVDGALRLYKEAAAGTAEAVRREPDDPKRLYEHAQNVFYFGDLAMQRGQLRDAEQAFREYKKLADRMVELQPDNLKWRTEVRYAEANLGSVLMRQRRFAEASRQIRSTLQTIEAVAAIDPRNPEYPTSISDALGWLADTEAAQGHLDNAMALRSRQIGLLERLTAGEANVQYRQRLILARQGLAWLLAAKGDLKSGVAEMSRSADEAEGLIPTEPNNTKWVEFAASSKIGLAQLLLESGATAQAQDRANAGCALVQRLMSRENATASSRRLLRDCLLARSEIALKARDSGALAIAEQALRAARSAPSADVLATRFEVVRAYRIIGDARARAGDDAGARAAWSSGLAEIPAGVVEKPRETVEHASILNRLGRTQEARQLARRLQSIGYRRLV